MSDLEIKNLDIEVLGDHQIDYNQDQFLLTKPYHACVTVGLGYKEEDGSTYFHFDIFSSRDEIDEHASQFYVISDTLTPKKLLEIVQSKLERANLHDDPIREAAKSMAWEYGREILSEADALRGDNDVF